MDHPSTLSIVLPDIVNFVLVMAVLYLATRKAFASAISSRSARVGGLVLEGQKAFEESSVDLKAWQAKWDASKAEIAGLYQDAEALMQKTRTQTLDRAKHEAERIRQEAKLVGQGEAARMMNQLQKEFAQKSVELAGRYLDGHLAEDDRKNLVKNYTEIVGNGASR